MRAIKYAVVGAVGAVATFGVVVLFGLSLIWLGQVVHPIAAGFAVFGAFGAGAGLLVSID